MHAKLFNLLLVSLFFIEGDENKKQLLDLGAAEALLKLLASEDRIVRRNACMAIGVLTAHRKSICMDRIEKILLG